MSLESDNPAGNNVGSPGTVCTMLSWLRWARPRLPRSKPASARAARRMRQAPRTIRSTSRHARPPTGALLKLGVPEHLIVLSTFGGDDDRFGSEPVLQRVHFGELAPFVCSMG